MKVNKVFIALRRCMIILLVLVLIQGLTVPAYASEKKDPYKKINTSHDDATFTYELFLTDQNGVSVTNPRKLSAGDTLFVQIKLTRNQFKESKYDSYGIEFRLLTRGLTYNNDGASLRDGTAVHLNTYMDGDSVGFAWYDMNRIGESFVNPVLAATWSYTVDDPSAINITVPVALIYVTGETVEHVPVGPARLFLDANGGNIVGKDVSGDYWSGEKVVLPEAEFDGYTFEGWSDGVYLYPAGSEYTVSGVVTLTAQWAGLERNRYVGFIIDGGTFVTEDPSGNYADGEIIILPDATREGYRLVGWSDGVNVYAPGDEYVVSNTVNLIAQWEVSDGDVQIDDSSKPAVPEKPGKVRDAECFICGRDHWLVPIIPLCWICLLIIIVIIAAIWLIIRLLLLLLTRNYIKYSLVNGDVKLNYKNDKRHVHVSVILDNGQIIHPIGDEETSTEDSHLRYIENAGKHPIAQIEPGIYDGKMIIKDETSVLTSKCKIKVVDKELR